jgi:hypothetical protein
MPKSTDRKTRGPTRRGRLQIQFRAVPAEELAPNPNNQLTTQDPVQRRHELLDGLAAALAKLAARRPQED